MDTANEINTGSALIDILFVDDEKNVLQALRRLFMEENYNVLLANSGDEALELLKNNPDTGLIVSDQRMPGMTGSEFLAKAKEMLPDAIRILLTGYADINAVADAINKGGASRYITKPWNDEELVQIIAESAKRFSLIKENKRLQKIVSKQNDELKRWNSQLEFFVQEQTIEIQNKSKELEKLNEGLKKNFKNSILAFSGLIELRDRKTGSHSKYVAEMSVKMARSMDLPDSEIEKITIAALLHDIGKIGIPDALLLKEWSEMDKEAQHEYMQHSVRGQAAIDSVENMREAGILIRHHHEWYNGMGFPDKLSEEKIPLGARIISLADFVERAVRNLSAGTAVDTAMNMVKNELGRKFDHKLFKHVEMPVKELCAKILQMAKPSMVEVELNVRDVKENMVISRDVKSGTGLLLLPRGTILNMKNIQSLKRYYDLDPSRSGIFVLVKR